MPKKARLSQLKADMDKAELNQPSPQTGGQGPAIRKSQKSVTPGGAFAAHGLFHGIRMGRAHDRIL